MYDIIIVKNRRTKYLYILLIFFIFHLFGYYGKCNAKSVRKSLKATYEEGRKIICLKYRWNIWSKCIEYFKYLGSGRNFWASFTIQKYDNIHKKKSLHTFHFESKINNNAITMYTWRKLVKLLKVLVWNVVHNLVLWRAMFTYVRKWRQCKTCFVYTPVVLPLLRVSLSRVLEHTRHASFRGCSTIIEYIIYVNIIKHLFLVVIFCTAFVLEIYIIFHNILYNTLYIRTYVRMCAYNNRRFVYCTL